MNERLRVLVIDKTGGLPSGRERFRALVECSDIELHVLCPRLWREHGLTFEASPESAEGYTLHTGEVCFPGYYARAFYRGGLDRAMSACRPQIIQLLEEPYALVTLQTLYLRRRLCPNSTVVFYSWENIYRDFRYPARVQFLYRFADRWSHRAAAGGVCATADAEGVLKRKGFPGRTAIIPYGVSSTFLDRLDRESPARAERYPFVLGYVGRLERMKGVDLLIRALPQLPEARLQVVGSGSQRQSLEREAESLGVLDRIRFFGALPSHEVRKHMENLNALVLPSRTTANWSEQLGRVMLEAMAVGVPVVASGSGSIPSVVAQAGILFEEDDLQGLVTALQQLRTEPRLADDLVRNGKARVREIYTWPRFAARLTEFYREIMKERSDPNW